MYFVQIHNLVGLKLVLCFSIEMDVETWLASGVCRCFPLPILLGLGASDCFVSSAACVPAASLISPRFLSGCFFSLLTKLQRPAR